MLKRIRFGLKGPFGIKVTLIAKDAAPDQFKDLRNMLEMYGIHDGKKYGTFSVFLKHEKA